MATNTMKNPKTKLKPFRIKDLMVALELGTSDEPVLNYIDFLSEHVPIATAYFAHVLPRFDLYSSYYQREASAMISNYEINTEVIDSMRKKLEARKIKANTLRMKLEVQEGNPLERMLEEAEDRNVDLLVIGQRSGSGEHGIVARNLARRVSGNALIVPEKSKRRLSRILVPIDFSENSTRALEVALEMKERLGDKLEVLAAHVYEMPNLSIYKVQKTFDQLKSMVEDDRRQAFDDFMEDKFPAYQHDVELVMIEREMPGIARYILDYAEDSEVDMILIGAKGHSTVERLLLGSVTEKLVSLNESIPTLVVRQ